MKGVADALDEGIEAVGVAAHQVASSHPRIAGLEETSESFSFRLDLFAVAFEALARLFANSSQSLADFAVGAANAEAVGAASRHLRAVLEADERNLVANRDIRRHAADRSDLAFEVVEPNIAFCRSVELKNA